MRQALGKYIGALLILTGVILAIFLILFQKGVLKSRNNSLNHKISSQSEVVISYPFKNSLFPPDMAAPTFLWNANVSGINYWKIKLSTAKKEIYEGYVFETRWEPDSLVWQDVKRSSGFEAINFSVSCNVDTGAFSTLVSDSIVIRFSRDSVSAPLFFRQIDLPFKNASEHLSSIEWRLGDISHYQKAKTLLSGVNLCGNCHSFSSNGEVLGIDFDYLHDKGGYATADITSVTEINREDFYSWNNLSANGKSSSGFLSSLSPDGRYVASTINDYVISSFHENEFRFFPVRGMLGIYDRFTGESYELAGANDSLSVQCNPTWSPDGQTIIFAKTKALSIRELSDPERVKMLAGGEQSMCFDLWAIPFNNGKGGIAKPLKGASSNGRSNYFPRVSGDCKWVVFTQANAYMLRQLDSKLMIIPFEGGEARELECNLKTMNSWHTWSPNGKWIAFSTKGFSPYTKIALTHIDESGHASPPVLLEKFIADSKAINLPEFVNIDFDEWASINLGFLKPLCVKSIDFRDIGDGHYRGESVMNGAKLRQIKATLDIEVRGGKITVINIVESKNIDNKDSGILNKIIQFQTLDMNQLKVNSTEDIVMILAVEDGLSKGESKE